MDVVCKQWTEDFEIYGYHIEDVLSLIKEAYRERAKEGISFATLDYTIEDFLAERTDADFWFLAFDNEKKMYGTARLTIKDDKSGEICNFAVSPYCQGKHVGSHLLQAANLFAKEHKLDCVLSFTAMKATSSVRCHCNNGFRIIGININLLKDYSSYCFRNQISPSWYWSNSFMMRLRYLLSYLKYCLAKRPNGQNRFIGNIYLKYKRSKGLVV